MMNWTRFFPTLLAAHRQLGAFCSGSPSAASDSSTPRGPALAMIAAAVFAWGAFAPSLRCPDHPGLAQDGAQPPNSTDLPVAAHHPSDDTPAAPAPNRPVPSAQAPNVPRVNRPPTSDCSDDAPRAPLFL